MAAVLTFRVRAAMDVAMAVRAICNSDARPALQTKVATAPLQGRIEDGKFLRAHVYI